MNLLRNGRTRVRQSIVSLGIGLLLAVALSPMPARAGAVGISPLSLEYVDALRGSTVVQTLQLSNEPSDGDSGTLSYALSAKGEIASWMTFLPLEGLKPLSKLEVAESKQAFVRVVIAVPAGSANRTYTGEVFIEGTTVGVAAKPGSVGVGTAQNVPVTVKVGGVERREAAVEDFSVDKSEVGLKQRFTAKIQNTGNVAVASELEVIISRDGKEVTTLSTKGQNFPVFPSVSDSVFAEWDTSEQLGGAYEAVFKVTDVAGLTPKVLGAKSLPFRLEPRGTFTRSGEFTTFELLEKPVQGDAVYAEGGFLNAGKIPTNAVLDSKVYFKDKLMKAVQSLPRTVRPGQTGKIGVLFNAVDAGPYTIKAAFNYDGEVTDERELKFEVVKGKGGVASSAKSGGSSNGALLAVGGVGGLAVVSGAVLFLRRRRRR